MASLVARGALPTVFTTETSNSHYIVPVDKRWWNMNAPRHEWSESCPDFLCDQPTKNILNLSVENRDHPRLSWPTVRSLIDLNHIDQFHRMPSDLRKYLEYCYNLKQRYGSVLYFIQHERLQWPTIEPTNDMPFTNHKDYKILYNDWPYSIDQDIVHIVVWTKFALQEDVETGKLTKDTKDLIETFVANTFCTSRPNRPTTRRSNLRWFKNPTSLRSVHALEHFHIMLYKPPADLICRVTEGDRLMSEQFTWQSKRRRHVSFDCQTMSEIPE